MLFKKMVVATQLEKASTRKCHWIHAILIYLSCTLPMLESATGENVYNS